MRASVPSASLVRSDTVHGGTVFNENCFTSDLFQVGSNGL